MMAHSEALKQQALRKLLGPERRRICDVEAEFGIPRPTLTRWVQAASTMGVMSKPAKRWSGAEKLRVVITAGSLSDEELGAFLRREGLHEAQLKQWRAEAEAALGATKV